MSDQRDDTLDLLAELANGLGSLDVAAQDPRAVAVIERLRSDRKRIDDAWSDTRAARLAAEEQRRAMVESLRRLAGAWEARRREADRMNAAALQDGDAHGRAMWCARRTTLGACISEICSLAGIDAPGEGGTAEVPTDTRGAALTSAERHALRRGGYQHGPADGRWTRPPGESQRPLFESNPHDLADLRHAAARIIRVQGPEEVPPSPKPTGALDAFAKWAAGPRGGRLGLAEPIARDAFLDGWRAREERRPRDPEAIARLDALFAAAPPEWQELFAELDRRDAEMRGAPGATLVPAPVALIHAKLQVLGGLLDEALQRGADVAGYIRAAMKLNSEALQLLPGLPEEAQADACTIASRLTPEEARRLAAKGWTASVTWTRERDVMWYETVDSDIAHLRGEATAADRPEVRDGELTCPCGDSLVESAWPWPPGGRCLYCCTCRSRFENGTLRELRGPSDAPRDVKPPHNAGQGALEKAVRMHNALAEEPARAQLGGVAADWTVGPEGVAQTSPAFRAATETVRIALHERAADIARGDLDFVARLVVARLAKAHGLAPKA